MKVLTVVGARPQFIKFEELEIPKPDHNLGFSGGSHACMTANMMIALEKVMLEECPDRVLLYGDTNSTLAAALTAAKLNLPIIHVVAGLRTHSATNPEEMNRICAEHLSSKLLVCTQSGMEECRREENTKDEMALNEILSAMDRLDAVTLIRSNCSACNVIEL